MSQTIAPPGRHRRRVLPIVLLVLVLALVALVLLWNWDWFIPLVEAEASSATGRRVTIEHLHVHLGRNTMVTADDVVVANPDGFPASKPLADIGALSVTASVMDYIRHGAIVLPDVSIDHPDIAATALPDGRNNFTLAFRSSGKPGGAPPQIGNLSITDGKARVIDPAIKSDFALGIATFAATPTRPAELVVTTAGTYAGQPITGKFVGGALLSLLIRSTCMRRTGRPKPRWWARWKIR
jgi:uncharacterized protein involved in outer membrane biogenesis